MNRLYSIVIQSGLRRFFAAETEIIIIMKDQKIQRRKLCNIDTEEMICEPDAADYDEEEYIGCVTSEDREIFLSHGSQISRWS